MLLIWLLGGLGQAQVTNEQKAQAIAELGKTLKARYVLLDVAEKAVQFLEQRLANGAYNTDDPRAFGAAVTVDLQAVTKDAHLRFGYAEPEPPAAEKTPEQEKARKDAEQAAMRQANFGFARAEILAGNVGYLDIRRFMPPDAAGDTLAGTMAFLANADALIVDIRNCTGGSAHMMPFFAAYFFARPTSLFDMVFRGDNFTEHFWTLAWIPGKRLADVPMYILTSARTFSGAEGFAYRFQVLKRATIVGEATGGGANAGGILDIAPCFRVWMPMGRPVDQKTGSNWEGTGVIPDVKTAARTALVSAHLQALEKLRAQAANPVDQQRLDWALERTKAAAQPVDPGLPELQRLAGTYGTARVWVEGGQLRYRRETEQTVLLTPLSATVFASELSDPVRLEFIRDRRGRVTRLQVTGYGFSREELPRLK
ncbi:MAG: S41 family peptidase [Candidatus Aminicenantes bacterium]|nr:S41 family peptidase [Candidatus Aminicenantes bacterium]